MKKGVIVLLGATVGGAVLFMGLSISVQVLPYTMGRHDGLQ